MISDFTALFYEYCSKDCFVTETASWMVGGESSAPMEKFKSFGFS